MTDSPVEYPRKNIFDAITEEFPTPFMYVCMSNETVCCQVHGSIVNGYLKIT